MAALFVYMNGLEVGEYIQHRGGAQEFIYSDAWLAKKENAIPLSLSLPLTDKKHKGDVVYNYFENLLPDSKAIRKRIQARLGAETDQPFDLLSHIGRDCVGAVQLLTEQAAVNVKQIEGEALSDSDIAEELSNYQTLPLGMSREKDFRISLAGAQEKTALLRHENQWLRPIGPTPTTHIFKLPIGRIEHSGMDLSASVENEWLCLQLLKAFGLPVPAATIATFEATKVLVVERFDRELAEDKSWIIRKPQEDLCQALGIAPGLKYESDGGPGMSQIMQVLASSIQPELDRNQFMQTVFLFWLLGAIDGHAKNFSLFLKQGGRFQLTPIYDVISAYPLASNRQIEYQDLKMAMALHSKNTHYRWHTLLPRHWLAEAKRNDFPGTGMQDIMNEVLNRLDSVIDTVGSSLPEGFPEDIARPIFEGMRKAAARCDS